MLDGSFSRGSREPPIPRGIRWWKDQRRLLVVPQRSHRFCARSLTRFIVRCGIAGFFGIGFHSFVVISDVVLVESVVGIASFCVTEATFPSHRGSPSQQLALYPQGHSQRRDTGSNTCPQLSHWIIGLTCIVGMHWVLVVHRARTGRR